MAREVYVAPKALALKSVKLIQESIPGTIIVSCESENYDIDGDVETYTLANENDEVELVLFLGNKTDPCGPFDGDCWIVVRSLSSIWSRWFKCGTRFENQIEDVIVSSGGRK